MNDRQWSGPQQQAADEPIGVTNWATLFPKDHIIAEDLWNDDTGKYDNRDVVIEAVVMREIFDTNAKQKTKKPIIRFAKAKKYMFLNHEIGEALQKITGQKDPQMWVGWTVNVYVFLQRHTPQGPKDVPRLRPIAGRSGKPAGQAAAAGAGGVPSDDLDQRAILPGNENIPF